MVDFLNPLSIVTTVITTDNFDTTLMQGRSYDFVIGTAMGEGSEDQGSKAGPWLGVQGAKPPLAPAF